MASKPPIIILTGFEENYVTPITRARGAVACLGKPIERQELASTFQKMLRKEEASSDRWGHMMPARIKNGRISRAFRVVAQKLSPVVQTRT